MSQEQQKDQEQQQQENDQQVNKLDFLQNREQIKKQINFENYFDDEEEVRQINILKGLLLEEQACMQPPQLDVESLPTKQYLDKTVIPTIYEAMKVLLVEKPKDPIEFFAYYLITNNPFSKKKMNESNEGKEEVQQ